MKRFLIIASASVGAFLLTASVFAFAFWAGGVQRREANPNMDIR